MFLTWDNSNRQQMIIWSWNGMELSRIEQTYWKQFRAKLPSQTIWHAPVQTAGQFKGIPESTLQIEITVNWGRVCPTEVHCASNRMASIYSSKGCQQSCSDKMKCKASRLEGTVRKSGRSCSSRHLSLHNSLCTGWPSWHLKYLCSEMAHPQPIHPSCVLCFMRIRDGWRCSKLAPLPVGGRALEAQK